MRSIENSRVLISKNRGTTTVMFVVLKTLSYYYFLTTNLNITFSFLFQSFVGKVKSIITNTPISKWFRKENTRPIIRRRDEDCEDDTQEMQPPSKRVKLPVDGDKNSYSNVFSETVVHNEVKKHKKICDYFPEPVAGPSGIHTSSLANGFSVNSIHNRLTTSEILSRRKDSDSEESTSGYSSVAKVGSKEQVYQSPTSSKQTSPSQKPSNSARSLFQTTPSEFLILFKPNQVPNGIFMFIFKSNYNTIIHLSIGPSLSLMS